MASLDSLPLELILKIGFLLISWDDIHCFSCVFRTLRKMMDYAKYARESFERSMAIDYEANMWIYTTHGRWRFKGDVSKRIVYVGDDRIRCYRNPWFDDRTVELWRTTYSWVDYSARFWLNEETSLTWIYLPYGSNFNGKEYTPTVHTHLKISITSVPTRHISVIEICAAFRQDNVMDKRVPMQNWLQEKVKKRYDNLYARMLFKEMTAPKLKYKDYGKLGYNKNPELHCKRYIRFENGMCYQKKCYPWVNEPDPVIRRNIRGKMKRKHCYGEVIDVRDFLDL